jgi:hypothetical protein
MRAHPTSALPSSGRWDYNGDLSRLVEVVKNPGPWGWLSSCHGGVKYWTVSRRELLKISPTDLLPVLTAGTVQLALAN